ncbi:MAG: hypothetical protein NTY88_02980 [Bacteroidetes bacterium]|nr:hypothetical protein [Bacteroidota bacterium]
MDFQYIIDEKGRKSSVIVPIKEWERRERLLEKKKPAKPKPKISDEYVPRTKQEILDGISRAVEEVKLARAGKLKLKTWDEIKDEL